MKTKRMIRRFLIIVAVAAVAYTGWQWRLFYLAAGPADLSQLPAEQQGAVQAAIATHRLMRPEPVSLQRGMELLSHPFYRGGPEPLRVVAVDENLLLLDRNTPSIGSVLLERVAEGGWREVPVAEQAEKLRALGS